MCCGQPEVDGKHVYLTLHSEMAVSEFQQISFCPPSEPAKFALRLLSVFFSDDVLAESNCTKAEGRKLLDQQILLGIRCEFTLLFWFTSL